MTEVITGDNGWRRFQCSILKVQIPSVKEVAQWLSWLERRPVTAEVEGSSPFWVVVFTTVKTNGILAQLGEHLPYKQGVTGSSPVGPIIFFSADVDQFMTIVMEWLL